MQVPVELLVPLAAVSGVSLSFIGVSFRLGQARGVMPVHIWLVGGIVGAVVMGALTAGTDWASVPGRVWLLGAAAGISQYAMLAIIRAALARGPLSPVWCAIMLGLMPAIVYSFVAVGERPSLFHFGAIASALACIVVATLGHKGDPAAPHPARGKERITYGLLLLGCLLVNGITAVCIKDLASHATDGQASYMDQHRNVFLMLLYGFLAFGAGMERLMKRRFGAPLRASILLGLLTAAASVLGMIPVCIAARAPASAVFTTSAVCSIISAAVISVLALGEKANAAWVATVALGVLTVVLANLG